LGAEVAEGEGGLDAEEGGVDVVCFGEELGVLLFEGAEGGGVGAVDEVGEETGGFLAPDDEGMVGVGEVLEGVMGRMGRRGRMGG